MSARTPTLQLTATGLLAVPAEVLESILVFCALANCPSAITALSETCRFFYELIYKTPDNHLWREIFLAVFDDPRSLHNMLRRPIAGNNEGPFAYDWLQEFQHRIAAKIFFVKYANLPLSKRVKGPKEAAVTPKVRTRASSREVIWRLTYVYSSLGA
jgi:hypothetical protein